MVMQIPDIKNLSREELISIVEMLLKRVVELENELEKYKHPKNSSNSSIPPSKDENRLKRKSLREKTGCKPGGQKGHEGNTLKMVENPDVIQKHIPKYCNYCGKDISNLPYEFVGKRQVIDIPEIKLHVTEHQLYKKVCTCGHETCSEYPLEANAPVSYGNNIEMRKFIPLAV